MTETLTSYPLAEWRLLLEDAPRTAAANMALDEAIMEAVARGESPPTLRFYQWDPPGLSLGKRQPLSGVDLDRCRRDGVEVVRRATGGFAILHTDELTYSVATLPDDPRAEGAILDAYRKLSQGLLVGLRLLGVPAQMNPVVPGGVHNASAACFEVPSAYEITARHRAAVPHGGARHASPAEEGRKLIGSAQTRPAGRVLQHGSLPLRGDIARVVEYLAFEDERERAALAAHLRERATTLGAVLGRDVSFAEAANAMRQGFARALNLRLVPGTLTASEQAAAEGLLAEKRVPAGGVA